MHCPICAATTEPFLRKAFDVPFAFEAAYRKCGNCGFVVSETHHEMSPAERDHLNSAYHARHSGENNPNDPNWLQRIEAQAATICRAARGGLIDVEGDWLDYGSGSGRLSRLIADDIGKMPRKFDAYPDLFDVDFTSIDQIPPRSFSLTINSAVFEHLVAREEWDSVDQTVAPLGTLALHTLVREEIPRDPSWFYYLPVHSAFFTNKAMSLLSAQWGYTCSVYDVASRLWLWFKRPAAEIAERTARINQAEQHERFLFKEGFLDYWK